MIDFRRQTLCVGTECRRVWLVRRLIHVSLPVFNLLIFWAGSGFTLINVRIDIRDSCQCLVWVSQWHRSITAGGTWRRRSVFSLSSTADSVSTPQTEQTGLYLVRSLGPVWPECSPVVITSSAFSRSDSEALTWTHPRSLLAAPLSFSESAWSCSDPLYTLGPVAQILHCSHTPTLSISDTSIVSKNS